MYVRPAKRTTRLQCWESCLCRLSLTLALSFIHWLGLDLKNEQLQKIEDDSFSVFLITLRPGIKYLEVVTMGMGFLAYTKPSRATCLVPPPLCILSASYGSNIYILHFLAINALWSSVPKWVSSPASWEKVWCYLSCPLVHSYFYQINSPSWDII